MSSVIVESAHIEGDLIDFYVGSPVLQRNLPTSNTSVIADESDNLLDSELPVLEKKLQTAPNSTSSSSRKDSVDVEDILISIYDDDEEFVGVKSVRRSNSEILLNLYGFHGGIEPIEKSLSCDNLEALDVLRNLDDILNASLLESNKILNIGDEDEQRHEQMAVQQTVEACLLDLDNYLQGFESSCDSFTHSSSSNCVETQRSSASSLRDLSQSFGHEAPQTPNINEASLKCKLRHMEENYAKFLASGYTNRGFVEDNGEIHRTESEVNLRCNAEELQRNHPTRITIAVAKRSNISKPALCYNPRWAVNRTSGTGADSDDDIDWSWLQDVAHDDVSLARRAHASRDCCTGTVVVEAPRIEPMQLPENVNWLRSSMRRLRHLRLPSDGAISPLERPLSAPSRLLPNSIVPSPTQRSRPRSREIVQGRARSSSASSRSRRPRSLDSSVSSLASTVDSSPSCTPVSTPIHEQRQQANQQRRPCERPASAAVTSPRHSDMPEAESPLGHWPYKISSMMACLNCTLGLFNINRFAILSINYGVTFVFQFFFLSLVFGLPLFTLQLCLGQQLGAGVIDMWRISPLFQGVGVSLLITQALVGLYSIVGVSWMFVFFRDSFITKMDRYRWAEPYLFYREDIQPPINGTYKLSETVPDYFSGIVLQRHHLASGSAYGTIKFQSAFNLAVVWMIVFVCLSKGLRSYGKVTFLFTFVPLIGMFLFGSKVVTTMLQEANKNGFMETSWNEFFLNSKCWLAAAQEAFLTWGLLGAAAMQIASHNKDKHLLQRDTGFAAFFTLITLLFVSFISNCCVQILRSYGYNYLPNSFERISTYTFLRSIKDPLPPSLASLPVRYMAHNSFIVGESVHRPGVDHNHESGYQALRFTTELIPATLAVLGADKLSPFWAVFFYFIVILFGIGQQLAIWHCVITGIMAIKAKVLKSWETTITLFSCACGFVLGLPMATELGIYVVYFMDYTIGGIWWLILVILLQIIAVFMVRGRPYSGDTVVTALFTSKSPGCFLSWAPALLSFTWNVILPVALMVLCITTFRNGNFKDIFIWHQVHNTKYWPTWVRQIGSMLQLIPILLVPIVAVIQSYRYLNNGPSDILDRIQLLYRPPIGEHMTDLQVHEAVTASRNSTSAALQIEDPPPKYTPPPSYTTATGARIAKFLRQSIRRSVRRLANVLGESSSSSRQRAPIQPPPPDYNAVLVEMNQAQSEDVVDRRISTLERLRNIHATPGSPTLTAAEVASILRSSFRRSTVYRTGRNVSDNNGTIVSLSAENLMESAAPIGETSLVHTPIEGEIKCETLSSVI